MSAITAIHLSVGRKGVLPSVTKQSVTHMKQIGTSVKQAGPLVKQTGTLVKQPGTPVKQPGTPAKQPGIRLTRRGRMVFFGVPAMLLVAALLSLAGFLNAPAKASDSANELRPTTTVGLTVQPGQSLWGIARAVAPDRDLRDVVSEIVELNNLQGGQINAGQKLFIPAQ
ncbi:LysM peptidoglycan-binding domain-containing protein [bacterium RCC_150]